MQFKRKRQFNEQQINFSIGDVRRCASIIEAENRRKRAQAGAAKRWEKKNQKTS
jgi:hypothetical protein